MFPTSVGINRQNCTVKMDSHLVEIRSPLLRGFSFLPSEYVWWPVLISGHSVSCISRFITEVATPQWFP